jgi:hypothetical protein
MQVIQADFTKVGFQTMFAKSANNKVVQNILQTFFTVEFRQFRWRLSVVQKKGYVPF